MTNVNAPMAGSRRPLNILHLRDTYEIGGPGKTILETFRAIDHDRYALHVGVFQNHGEPDDTPFTRAADEYGMPVHRIVGSHPYDPRVVGRVAALVDRLGIDIVHAHEAKSDVVSWLLRRRRDVPIMTTVHGWIGNSRKDRFLVSLDQRILRGFDCVIAVSGLLRDQLAASGVPEGRLRMLHNAIVLDKYKRNGRRGYLEGLVGRPLPGPVVATIGRLSPEKGHADFVDALGIAASRGCRVSAVLAGDGPCRSALAERIRRAGLEGWVHFVGHVSRPADVLEESDLMVLPSHTEGLPNVVLEAFAMEVPVLATPVGGTPEVVADGVTGRLVPVRSPERMAESIMAFASDPASWRRLTAEARRVVEREFDFTVRTRRLEAIYDDVADGRTRA